MMHVSCSCGAAYDAVHPSEMHACRACGSAQTRLAATPDVERFDHDLGSWLYKGIGPEDEEDDKKKTSGWLDKVKNWGDRQWDDPDHDAEEDMLWQQDEEEAKKLLSKRAELWDGMFPQKEHHYQVVVQPSGDHSEAHIFDKHNRPVGTVNGATDELAFQTAKERIHELRHAKLAAPRNLFNSSATAYNAGYNDGLQDWPYVFKDDGKWDSDYIASYAQGYRHGQKDREKYQVENPDEKLSNRKQSVVYYTIPRSGEIWGPYERGSDQEMQVRQHLMSGYDGDNYVVVEDEDEGDAEARVHEIANPKFAGRLASNANCPRCNGWKPGNPLGGGPPDPPCTCSYYCGQDWCEAGAKRLASVPTVTDAQVSKFQGALSGIGYTVGADEAHDILLLNGGYQAAMNAAGVVQDVADDIRGSGDLPTEAGWGLSSLVETTDGMSWYYRQHPLPTESEMEAMRDALRTQSQKDSITRQIGYAKKSKLAGDMGMDPESEDMGDEEMDDQKLASILSYILTNNPHVAKRTAMSIAKDAMKLYTMEHKTAKRESS